MIWFTRICYLENAHACQFKNKAKGNHKLEIYSFAFNNFTKSIIVSDGNNDLLKVSARNSLYVNHHWMIKRRIGSVFKSAQVVLLFTFIISVITTYIIIIILAIAGIIIVTVTIYKENQRRVNPKLLKGFLNSIQRKGRLYILTKASVNWYKNSDDVAC